jgi:hypothetical protein
LTAAGSATAQEPEPSPRPREQDELDFQGRSSVLVGSGARALGMGGAFLARADDATAASWNPAGLSYLRRPEISLVGVHSTANETTQNATTGFIFGSDRSEGDAPDFLSAAYPVTLGAVSGAIQLSFQRVISFTGDRRIQEELNPLRLVNSRQGFDVLALGTGMKVAGGLRVGVTVNRWFHGFQQTRERVERRRTFQEVDFELSGLSVNAGIIWTPVEHLNLGVSGKTPMRGDVRLSRLRTDFYDEPLVVTQNAHQSDDVRLDLPGAVGVGVSWRPASTLTLSADYTWTFWSAARIRNYFTLAATPAESPDKPPPPEIFPSLLFPRILDSGQNDTAELRAGLEYVLIWRDLRVPLRAGFLTETQYFRVEGDKAPRFSGFSVGAGIVGGPFLLDVAYLHESGSYVREDPGRTDVTIRRLLFSLIYRHGAGQ